MQIGEERFSLVLAHLQRHGLSLAQPRSERPNPAAADGRSAYARAMARLGHPIHDILLDRLDLTGSEVVCDLGCGEGATLVAAFDRYPDLTGLGIDRDPQFVATARARLARFGADVEVGDVASTLPWPEASIDRLLCHNVLECVSAPVDLIASAARHLRPGGRAVWSHVDFDGLVIAGEADRSRRILHAYADATQAWMDHSDGRVGRKIPGFVRQAGMDLVDASVHTLVETTLTGDALARVNEIGTVLESGDHGVTADDVDAWRRELDELDIAGAFFFAQPTVVVVATV
ncbi:MAG: methyltransferase domain-containing protein [Actinomycetota bacterium]